MKQAFVWVRDNWFLALFWSLSALLLLVVCFYNLESITHSKLSGEEISALSSAKNAKDIVANPLFLPYKLGEFVVLKLGSGSVYLMRAIPAFFGLVLSVLFFALTRHWFSAIIAWLSTAMLVTSGLFLNYSRLAVPDILLPLALLSLMACAWWIYQTKHSGFVLFVSGIMLAAVMYIPGIIWFCLLAIVAQRRHLRKTIKKVPVMATVGFFMLAAVLLAPLVRAFILNPILIRDWLAIPSAFNVMQTVRDFVFVPASLIVRSLPTPAFNIGRLPYLNIITVVLAALGSYAFLLRLDLVRTRAMIGAVLISWVLIALQNSVSITLVLPLIFLTVAAGIMFMLQQWFIVFPKNPIARSIGLVLIVSLVSIGVYYNGLRYFVAWPNNPATRITFQQNLPPNLLQ